MARETLVYLIANEEVDWFFAYTPFLRQNDLPVVLGGTGNPVMNPTADQLAELTVAWLMTPIEQLYAERGTLLASQPGDVPRLMEWVSFYDALIRWNQRTAPAA